MSHEDNAPADSQGRPAPRLPTGSERGLHKLSAQDEGQLLHGHPERPLSPDPIPEPNSAQDTARDTCPHLHRPREATISPAPLPSEAQPPVWWMTGRWAVQAQSTRRPAVILQPRDKGASGPPEPVVTAATAAA